jgi:hypothetical protein
VPIDFTASCLTIGEYLDDPFRQVRVPRDALTRLLMKQDERFEMIAQIAGLLYALEMARPHEEDQRQVRRAVD